MKSSLLRLRTICLCLSRTVAKTFTTFTCTEKVGSCWLRNNPPLTSKKIVPSVSSRNPVLLDFMVPLLRVEAREDRSGVKLRQRECKHLVKYAVQPATY